MAMGMATAPISTSSLQANIQAAANYAPPLATATTSPNKAKIIESVETPDNSSISIMDDEIINNAIITWRRTWRRPTAGGGDTKDGRVATGSAGCGAGPVSVG
ncbi:hypothetical protein Dimus_024514 [Dionaea muscipula]